MIKKILFPLIPFAFLLIIHLWSLDGLNGWLWSLGFKEDTEFAQKYTASAFRNIKIGMKINDVKNILGEPIETFVPTSEPEVTVLCYSKSPEGTHYRIRQIIISNNFVVGKNAEFYVD